MERLAYNVDEAAEIIGISRRLLYELLRTGELGSIKIRNRRVIRRSDITTFLDAHEPAA